MPETSKPKTSADTSTPPLLDLPRVVQQAIRVLRGFTQMELMRAGATVLQDLGIEHPHYNWASSPEELGAAMQAELFPDGLVGGLAPEYVMALQEIHRVGNVRHDAGQMAVAVAGLVAHTLFMKVAQRKWSGDAEEG